MVDLTPFIIYEDSDILVLNKPAGIVVHPDGRTKEDAVSEWLVAKYPEVKGVGEKIVQKDGSIIERPGIVHRIDRDTSGCLLLAKTERGYDILKDQFQARAIDKKYFAFLYGKLNDDHGTISFPISRSTADFRKWIAQTRIQNTEGRGELRDAVTYFQVQARLPASDGHLGATLVEAKPKTGRTHQIRVHFKALQRPVIKDPLYAVGQPSLLGFQRLALHAREITFQDTEGKSHTVRADFPEDFITAFGLIGYVPK
jgi:23S rRNA pseudouridine1911/1915/1917 synthase